MSEPKLDMGSVVFLLPIRIRAESGRQMGVEWSYVEMVGEVRSYVLHLFANKEAIPHGLRAVREKSGAMSEDWAVTRDEVSWWQDAKGVELVHCPVGGPHCGSLYHAGPSKDSMPHIKTHKEGG